MAVLWKIFNGFRVVQLWDKYNTSDENNKITGVIVPIDLWHELQTEKETAYLLESEAMRERLLTAHWGHRTTCRQY